jgi:hypothetical protein
MTRRLAAVSLFEIAVAVFLIIAAVSSRFFLVDYPNFKPIAAIALFAGFYFRSMTIAVCIPTISMLVSDAFFGGYEWQIALSVYGCLLGAAVFGRFALNSAKDSRKTVRTSAVLIAPFLTATFFFLCTNFATWMYSGWYEQSSSGLAACFIAGLAFFKYTLAGDLLFTYSVFGSYLLAVRISKAIPVLQKPNGNSMVS